VSEQVYYKSKRQQKIELGKLEQKAFLLEKAKEAKEAPIKERWENAQLQAATWQSVLDHAVELYNTHKDELEEEVITETEKQIEARQTQIKEFLMTEKDIYLEAMGIQAD